MYLWNQSCEKVNRLRFDDVLCWLVILGATDLAPLSVTILGLKTDEKDPDSARAGASTGWVASCFESEKFGTVLPKFKTLLDSSPAFYHTLSSSSGRGS